MMPLDTTDEELLMGDFEFGSLGFIWDLVFGAWNFNNLY